LLGEAEWTTSEAVNPNRCVPLTYPSSTALADEFGSVITLDMGATDTHGSISIP